VAAPVIFNDPGKTWVNDTGKVRYQFVASLQNTCGACLQMHLAIGSYWPIPIHRRCRCRQIPIGPGATAPHAFVDFRAVLDEMPHDQQVRAIGASNYKLLQKGVVKWDEIVTKYRVRTLREVVALNKVSEATALAAGVKPGIAKVAYAAVAAGPSGAAGSIEATLIRAHREELIAKIQGAGVSQEALVDSLARGITGRVTIVGPGGVQSMEPLVAARKGPNLLAIELARLFPPKPPPPEGPPTKPEPPVGPAPTPTAPTIAPAVVPIPEPESAYGGPWPIEPQPKKERKPRIAKPKKGKAFEAHDLGASKAPVKFEKGARLEAKRIFGRTMTPKKLASLAGAPDDARVTVEKYIDKVTMTVHHPQIDSMQRTIRREGDKIIIHNDIFKIKPEFQQDPRKIGLRAFAREAQHAHDEGVSHIETNAFRVKGSVDPDTGKERWAGYYVWPRYGYDGPIPHYSVKSLPQWKDLPEHLQEAKNVSELMVDPVGRKWWQTHGDAIDVVFDLKADSYSMKTLNSYLKETIPVVK
jgi:hypothetical protein